MLTKVRKYYYPIGNCEQINKQNELLIFFIKFATALF